MSNENLFAYTPRHNNTKSLVILMCDFAGFLNIIKTNLKNKVLTAVEKSYGSSKQRCNSNTTSFFF